MRGRVPPPRMCAHSARRSAGMRMPTPLLATERQFCGGPPPRQFPRPHPGRDLQLPSQLSGRDGPSRHENTTKPSRHEHTTRTQPSRPALCQRPLLNASGSCSVTPSRRREGLRAALGHTAGGEIVSARILGRHTAAFTTFLFTHRVPRGFTRDPSTVAPRGVRRLDSIRSVVVVEFSCADRPCM